MKRLSKITYVFIFISMVFVVCTATSCQSYNREWSYSERDYEVLVYSGDSLVYHDKFHGIINQEDNSDGIFYYKGDTLIEIGGNYIIKSEK